MLKIIAEGSDGGYYETTSRATNRLPSKDILTVVWKILRRLLSASSMV